MSSVEVGWVKCLTDEPNGGFCTSGAEPLGFSSTVLSLFLKKKKEKEE
jgi:hypothetical protein